jgi:pyridoxal phosphate enzyme (YggS family)
MDSHLLSDLSVDAQAIAANLDNVRERIHAAARKVGRSLDSVTLVAVSKTHPLEAIAAAFDHGQRDFGENRFEELWSKVDASQYTPLAGNVRWHMIGTIQGRKTDQAVGPFVLLHSIDRLKIAQRISRDAVDVRSQMPVLLEINVSGEPSKHGFTQEELVTSFSDLLQLAGISIQGLMTMAPIVSDPEETRPLFRELRRLRNELTALHRVELPHLSMGMSNDFEVAIEEGATLVRIGTAIFGARCAV